MACPTTLCWNSRDAHGRPCADHRYMHGSMQRMDRCVPFRVNRTTSMSLSRLLLWFFGARPMSLGSND